MRPVTPIAREITRESVIHTEPTIAPASCDHVYESTSRYNRTSKQLTFLLVCPVCGTEKVIETCHYEPGFQPSAANEHGGATVHQLPVRRSTIPARRAA